MPDALRPNPSVTTVWSVLAVPNDAEGRAIPVQLRVEADPNADAGTDEPLLHWSGGAQIGDDGLAALRRSVEPWLKFCLSLGFRGHRLHVSLIAPTVATVRQVSLRIDGPSLQAAIAVACLGAWARVPIRQDVVITGAVVSPEGRLGLVGDLGAKRSAVLRHPQFNKCVYARSDGTCESLELGATPADYLPEDAERRVTLLGVWTLNEVLVAAMAESGLVQGGLARRAHNEFLAINAGSPVAKVLKVLDENFDERFWREYQRQLTRRKFKHARALLSQHMRNAIKARRYPTGAGARVRHIACVTRPARDAFPLLPLRKALRVALLARGDQIADALELINVVNGPSMRSAGAPSGAPDLRAGMAQRASWLLQATSERSLAERIDQPIDEALRTFSVERTSFSSLEAAWDFVERLYAQLAGPSWLGFASAQLDLARAKAHALLDSAFARDQGVHSAMAILLTGAEGGAPRVALKMAERFKQDLRHEHFQRVLHEALEPLSSKQKVLFVRSLLKRLRPLLPSAEANRRAEDFLERPEQLIQLLIDLRSQLARSLRRF